MSERTAAKGAKLTTQLGVLVRSCARDPLEDNREQKEDEIDTKYSLSL